MSSSRSTARDQLRRRRPWTAASASAPATEPSAEASWTSSRPGNLRLVSYPRSPAEQSCPGRTRSGATPGSRRRRWPRVRCAPELRPRTSSPQSAPLPKGGHRRRSQLTGAERWEPVSRRPRHLPAKVWFHAVHPRIGALRAFQGLAEERIILGTALVAHLRKRINAQRFVLSTCKAGALPTELRPRVLMSINMSHPTRRNTYVTPILSPETAQRL
jgi:hypothetical protein